MTGCLQRHARKYSIPIDSLKVDFELTDTVLIQEEIAAIHAINLQEEPYAYKDLTTQEDGVYVHGMFLDAGRIDMVTKRLVDPIPGNNLIIKHFIHGPYLQYILYAFPRRPVSSTTRHTTCANRRFR